MSEAEYTGVITSASRLLMAPLQGFEFQKKSYRMSPQSSITNFGVLRYTRILALDSCFRTTAIW